MSEVVDHEEILELVQIIDREGEDLTEWEIEFIASIIDEDIQQFTRKQAAIVRRIHKERVE